MPFDDYLADREFPYGVVPSYENSGKPCFFNMRTYWTIEEEVPSDFDWLKWRELLPKHAYGGPVVLMNVKNGTVPLITEVPGGEKAVARDELALFAQAARRLGCTSSARMFEEDDEPARMCEGCKVVSMDDAPAWMKKCKQCYFASKAPPAASTGPRTCECGVSLQGLEHWKTSCLECFKSKKKKERQGRRFSPY